ncbi:DUF7282 domain-containing protein [Natronorarus salvus]|uniref:DUF7282 domain-containing protein n=1 Tax=Natronorarus salvus TaxID=3117733 RepID=UPI002F266E1B
MAIRTVAGALTLGAGFGGLGSVSAEHQENYAEIDFSDQRSNGTTVTVDYTKLRADGFITVHTWDLIVEQDGPGTIVGVSRHLEPGEYVDEVVRLIHPTRGFSSAFDDQNRLSEDQRPIVVPHRDMEHIGEFDFAVAPYVDIPFTNGTREREDLPVEGAVNNVASVTVAPPAWGRSRGAGRGMSGRR